jgi:replication factor C subunit 1
MAKVEKLNIKTLDEDGFYNLINSTNKNSVPPLSDKNNVESLQVDNNLNNTLKTQESSKPMNPASLSTSFYGAPSSALKTLKFTPQAKGKGKISYELWTDKYKPKTYDEIIGNKPIIDKLALWLRLW